MPSAGTSEGIDVLLTGHQHRQLTANIHGVTVIQPGFSGNGAGACIRSVGTIIRREMADYR
ncbi:hypothetical protein Q0F98_23160 [Paenibacillus amylolyticus]|nr:hypothetical protein Q0F98_23160 [Paenibacillus amylolyticus]